MRIELGGRAFVPVGTFTVRHHYETMALLARAGLSTPARAVEEELADYGRRILMQFVQAGVALDLVSHLVAPEGVDWTPDVARATADFVGNLTSEEDKQRVDDVLVAALVPFFEAIGTSGTSMSTSSDPRAARATGRVRGASGRRSSARSRRTIGSALAAWWTGLWRKPSPVTRGS